ncbi:uncharacterized protein PV07_07631 [Cladophialophora immunda]|uniref:Extracellular membrane protein CFEM domain-containing protein n=1 Tax=Cladophialophora immunda TaxID=569365 RepID=A0A0D2CC38_9EURO|nr:uncharacterized protein PV07_07631 [Cladophialophora immunda]KIW27935.1 hypothetical protein PV07_07631 [Cladophialophora immunda]
MFTALFLTLPAVFLATLVDKAAAADFNDYELDNVFAKRQNYTCSTAGLQDVCETNTADCISAMCESCSGYVYIANCCALSSYTAMMQCLLELENDPSEITMTVGSTSTTGPNTSTITAPSSAATSGVSGLEACSDFEAIVLACENETPGFSTEAFGQQASCLCYSNGTYQPDLYDGMFSGCLAYLSTADPSEYSSIVTGSVDLAPCKKVATTTQPQSSSSTHYIGHLTTSASTAAPTSGTPSPTTSTGPTQTPAADSNGSSGLESNSAESVKQNRQASLGWFLWLWGTCVVATLW